MRLTLDSNILIYSIDAATPEKQRIAIEILERAPYADAILTIQALGEFLKVVRRKKLLGFGPARRQAERWASIFPLVSTSWEHIRLAAGMAERNRLQFWDCVIWQAARLNGAEIMLSEDLQDGLTLEGMTVVNPFLPGNSERVAAMLASSRGL